MVQYNLSFAGAGRVAEALCREMYRAGHRIIKIVSESPSSGKSLAIECDALWSGELNFNDRTDIIIVAVPDQRLADVLSEIQCSPDTLIAHTAGSYGLDVFPDHIKNKGVFYPLQTFSKGRNINFIDLPFLLETNNGYTAEMLGKLALSIKGKVHFIDVERRKKVHLAAVFICNFTNYMLTIGKEITAGADIPFEWFENLIRETISKALENGPEFSQTGPAVRNDMNTIGKHLELLSSSPDIQKLYNDITQSIIQHYK